MKKSLRWISYLGLLLTFLSGPFVLKGVVTLETHYKIMTIGMLLWFTTAPFWMHGPSLEEEN